MERSVATRRPHHAAVVVTDVPAPYVVAPQHQYIGSSLRYRGESDGHDADDARPGLPCKDPKSGERDKAAEDEHPPGGRGDVDEVMAGESSDNPLVFKETDKPDEGSKRAHHDHQNATGPRPTGPPMLAEVYPLRADAKFVRLETGFRARLCLRAGGDGELSRLDLTIMYRVPRSLLPRGAGRFRDSCRSWRLTRGAISRADGSGLGSREVRVR
jgi:hypothetical protein